MDFKEKVVLITGSSIGIGKETALKFAAEESKVIITYYKDEKEAQETYEKCIQLGASDVFIVQLNIMDNASIKIAIKAIVEKFGKISILINNAGVVEWKPLEDQEFDDIEKQIRTNLEGLIKVTRESLPYIKDTIINISSGAGKSGFSDLTVYCASKFGVRGFTQALSQELTGIKVYSINPGTTSTRMTNFTGTPPEIVAEVILNAAKGVYDTVSGGDIDVWEVI